MTDPDINLQAQQEDSREPTVYPTLVIGLGGTGVKTLRYLRRRLKDEFGSRIEEEPQLVQLLGVDTVPLENRSSVEALHQHEYAYIGGFNAQRVIQSLERFKEINRWWDWNPNKGMPLGYISTGAKQLRTIGRLAFYRRFHMYNSRLEAKLNRLAHIQAHQTMHENRRPTQDQLNLPHVFIVSSLAGGTGSGTFLDVACHLRNKLQDQARIIGVLVMPSVFEEDIPSLLQQRRIRANAYAALKELDYFQSGNVFETEFPEQGPVALHGGIFTHVFLLDRLNVSGFQVSTQSDVQQLIADFIFQVSVTPMAGEIWEMDANVSREQDEGRSLSYSSLGYSSIIVDERARAEKLWTSYAQDISGQMRGWLDESNQEAILTSLGKVTHDIGSKATESADLLLRKDEKPTTVYTATMRDEARRLIVNEIAANLRLWGVAGVQSYIENLIGYYDTVQDDQEETERLNEVYKEAAKEVKRELPKRWQRWSDLLSNRTATKEEDDLVSDASGARINAQRAVNAFRIMREAAAPDLLKLLGRLHIDLIDYLAGLDSVAEGATAPEHPPLDAYPLRTILSFDGVDGADGRDGAYFETVKETAAELSDQWTYVGDGRDDTQPLVYLTFAGNDQARHTLIDRAHALMLKDLKDSSRRSSLYDLLYHKHRQEGGREEVYDLLRDFIRRCVPYVRLDFDRHNFSEKNIEPAYLLCLPTRLMADYRRQGSVFWALASGDYDFKPTKKPGRPDRMDALCVSHGYPLRVFADLPDMFNEYISTDLGASPLHLRCSWRRLMSEPIHDATPEELERERSRHHLFDALCANSPDNTEGGRPAPSSARPTPPADQPTTKKPGW